MARAADEITERTLLLNAIERIVANAKGGGATIRAGYHAGMLAADFPNCNFSIGRIVDEVVLAATRAGVPVEIARPD
jgi:hypothetical protein